MNRAWIRLLACGLLCVLLLSGCAGEPVGDDYALYFRARDLRSAAGEGALQAERWTPPEQDLDTAALAEAMMEALLAGPAEETLQNTIPAGTALLSLTLNGSQAVVDLSPAYSSLSGVELTLADQAVALTLTQLPEILSVRNTVRGQELADRDKQVFTGQDVLLAPEGDVVDTVTAALYFPNADGVLTEETRTLNLYEGDTQVGVIVRALEDGPETEGLTGVMPEGFRPRGVWLEENVCYVNLSSRLLERLPEDARLDMTLEALARSLCSLETVEETQFLVDGEFAAFYGSVDISEPFLYPDEPARAFG